MVWKPHASPGPAQAAVAGPGKSSMLSDRVPAQWHGLHFSEVGGIQPPLQKRPQDLIFTGFSFFPSTSPSFLLPSLFSSAPWDHSQNHCPINPLQPGPRREHER